VIAATDVTDAQLDTTCCRVGRSAKWLRKSRRKPDHTAQANLMCPPKRRFHEYRLAIGQEVRRMSARPLAPSHFIAHSESSACAALIHCPKHGLSVSRISEAGAGHMFLA
jgi:hypothetical protein